jgi:hypothetical protein
LVQRPISAQQDRDFDPQPSRLAAKSSAGEWKCAGKALSASSRVKYAGQIDAGA